MNQAEKELYLREYSVLKNQGKPFYPYALAKDSLMAAIVLLVIIFLSLMFGAELGPVRNCGPGGSLSDRAGSRIAGRDFSSQGERPKSLGDDAEGRGDDPGGARLGS